MSLNFKKNLYRTSSLLCLAALAIPATAVAEDASPPPAVSTAQAQTAQAQTAGNGGIGEIVVTANKRSESLSKVGMAVKALTGEKLEQQHITSLADLASAVPGLTFTQSEYGTPVFTLRGIGFYETSLAAYPDVSVYLDQAPLPLPVQTQLTLFDIQRVEVLEGPQGTLFGNNATGGAINYIANKPTPNFDAGADVSYGNYNTFQADGFVSGPITDKLRARFAFNTTEGDGWQHSDARPLSPATISAIQVTQPTANVTPNTQAGDINGAQDKAAIRFIVDWTPTDDLNVEWNLNGWHDGSQPQQPQLIRLKPGFGPGSAPPGSPAIPFVPGHNPVPYGGTLAGFQAYAQYNNEPTISGQDASVADWPGGALAPRADNSLIQSTLRVDYDLTDTIKLTSITDYVNYSRNQRDEGGASQWTDADIGQSRGYANTISQELRAAGGGDGPYRWVGGLNYEYDNVFERDSLIFGQSLASHNFGNASDSLPVLLGINPTGIPEVGSAFDSKQNMSNYAVFANGEYDFLSQFTAKAGVRFTQANRSDDACTTYDRGPGDPGSPSEITSFLFTGPAAFGLGGLPAFPGIDKCFLEKSTFPTVLLPRYTNRLDQDNVAWHAGLDWKPADNILTYANVSRGFKAGSFPTLPGTAVPSQEPVQQEYVTDYEIGAKTQFFDHHLTFNATGFYYDYKDKQLKGRLLDKIFGTLNALVNIPASSVYGSEVEIHARPMAGLDIGAQATYLDASVDKFTGFNAAGGPVPVNYDHTNVPFTPKWALSGTVDYEHSINDRLVGFAGAQVNYRSSATAAIGSPEFYGMPAYATLDLQAGVETSDYKWRFFLWGKNVTNSFYLTNVVESEDAIVRYTGLPVTFGATVSYRY